MMSIRLWRSISQASIADPIFRRVSQSQRQSPTPKPRRPSRLLLLAAACAMLAAVAQAPSLLLLVLILPMLLLALMVATPVLLPLYAWIAGLQLTAEVIAALSREKHQHTYELLGATPRGRLDASWSLAIGALYRCPWFAPLHWGTRLTVRVSLALLCGLSLMALLWTAAGRSGLGMEQARLILLPALGLALYWSNLAQTMSLSLALGLLCGGLDLSRQDATVVGLFGYVALSLLPVVAGLVGFVALGEVAGIAAVLGARELGLWLVWQGLGWREVAGKPSLFAIESLR